jgi:two-component system, NarL family, nitrate/nitrite response regulator NarL
VGPFAPNANTRRGRELGKDGGTSDVATPARPVRVLFADRHPVFRYGLRRLLAQEQDLQIVGEASNGQETVMLARQLNPDVLLVEMALPGLCAAGVLRALQPANCVRAIGLADTIDKRQTLELLQAGARGVLLKDSDVSLVPKSIRAVMAGQYWIGRDGLADIMETLRQLGTQLGMDARKPLFKLTARELEIITAIVTGDTNKGIAAKFSIREDTAKHHLTHIFDKVGVSTRLELALFAIHHHLVTGLTTPV